MFQKFFTPKEANRRLPYVKKIVEEILENGKRLRQLLPRAHEESIGLQCEYLTEEINKRMHELEELGCFYKDWNFEIGLVDFPAKIDGEDALLCWRSDEPEILWYHSMYDGYAGRRPLPAEWLLGEDLFKEK